MTESAQVEMNAFYKKYKAFRKNITHYQPVVNTNLIPLVNTLANHKDKVACFKGCSWCCHYRVVARTHEIVAIYTYINTKITRNVREQIKAEILETASIIDGISDKEHEQTNIKCPMLQAGKCAIYEVRPSKCAGYCSTSDSDCEQLFNLTKTMAGSVILDIELQRQNQDDKMDAVLDYEGHDKQQYELVTSLAALFDQPQLISRWRKNGKPIFTRLG